VISIPTIPRMHCNCVGTLQVSAHCLSFLCSYTRKVTKLWAGRRTLRCKCQAGKHSFFVTAVQTRPLGIAGSFPEGREFDTHLQLVQSLLVFVTSCWPIQGVGLQPLDCWDRRFESRWRHGCLSVVFVVCRVGRGPCHRPITRLGESSTVCVCLTV
jgi:hypothetical protein